MICDYNTRLDEKNNRVITLEQSRPVGIEEINE